MSLENTNDLVNIIVSQDDVKLTQLRFCITEFRGKQYLGIRRWTLDYESNWIPTKEGISMEYTLDSTTALWFAFAEILSETETLPEVLKNVLESNPDLLEKIQPE